MPEPYDPMCNTLARDMHWLDFYKDENQTRENYVIENEGTYNPYNGHFLCDECYTKAGMPSSPTGWKCP